MDGIVRGFGDLGVTAHHHASSAALEVLATGGNAVDAAVAANAVQGVVAPETCGIGGDLFALIHEPGNETPTALDGSGWAGSGVDADRLLAEHGSMPRTGPDAITIPGCVAGWEALLAQHGSRPLADLLAPAIRIAREGIVVTEELSATLNRRYPHLRNSAIADELLPGGAVPTVGSRLSRPTLAATLEGIAERGRAAFYEGPVAGAISGATQGRITPDDLGGYVPEWVEPLSLDLFEMTGWTMPPSSQGYLTLTALAILERLDHTDDPVTSVHREIEACRLAASGRDHVLADRRHLPVTTEALLDPARIDDLADRVDDRSLTSVPPPRPAPGGTAYLCVVDSNGVGISLMQSNFHAIGTNVAAGRHGFTLHDRGGGFSLEPGHPNRLGPGKRPLHTLAPTIWTRGHALAAILGSRGGDHQPQIVTQLARRLWADGLPVDTALRAPRWILDDVTARTESRPRLEATNPGFGSGLADRGHHPTTVGPHQRTHGQAAVITIDGRDLRRGAPDPRVRTTHAFAR